MNALTVQHTLTGIILVCQTHGVVDFWNFEGLTVADIAAAEHEHALTHLLEMEGIS